MGPTYHIPLPFLLSFSLSISLFLSAAAGGEHRAAAAAAAWGDAEVVAAGDKEEAAAAAATTSSRPLGVASPSPPLSLSLWRRQESWHSGTVSELVEPGTEI